MILLTGATGFVGRHLVRRLCDERRTVRVLVRPDQAARAKRNTDVEIAVGDVTDSGSLEKAMDGVETVIHLVSVIAERGEHTFATVNVAGTRTVVEEARKAGIRRLLYMSANGAADQPQFPYLWSKWRAEQEVLSSGLPFAILRPSLIFGEGDQFFNTLAMLVRFNPVVPVAGAGTSLFQPIWVEDVSTCLLTLVEDDSLLGQAYSVGGPERLSYDQMMQIVMRVLGKRRPLLHVPIGLMRPIAGLMQTVLPHPPVTPGQLDLLRIDNVIDGDDLRRLGVDQPALLQAKLGYIVGR